MCIRDRYHPSSNPAERVLREVGRILRTYCHQEHKNWSQYIEPAETFLNWSYHDTIGTSPYQVMFDKPPPREITSLINFPPGERVEFDQVEMHNRVLRKVELQQKRDQGKRRRLDTYQMGDKVLIKNRQLPSSIEGIARKLLLLYTGPYLITQVKGNNTYEIKTINNNKIKGM